MWLHYNVHWTQIECCFFLPEVWWRKRRLWTTWCWLFFAIRQSDACECLLYQRSLPKRTFTFLPLFLLHKWEGEVDRERRVTGFGRIKSRGTAWEGRDKVEFGKAFCSWQWRVMHAPYIARDQQSAVSCQKRNRRRKIGSIAIDESQRRGGSRWKRLWRIKQIEIISGQTGYTYTHWSNSTYLHQYSYPTGSRPKCWP